MKQGSTIFLRLVVIIFGLAVFALCFFVLPAIYNEWGIEYPEVAYLKYPVLLVLSATAVSFYVALYQTMKVLGYIDTGKAFSVLSVKVLRNIKYCAVVIGVLYAAGLPLVYYVADIEDAPGIMLIGLVITGASFAIATFAAVLQKLLRSAIDIKSENDLTV